MRISDFHMSNSVCRMRNSVCHMSNSVCRMSNSVFHMSISLPALFNPEGGPLSASPVGENL